MYKLERFKLSIDKLLALLITNKKSVIFIAINIVVAFIGFFRSFIFIEFLDFEELGMITLIQTLAGLIGFCQLGLINGGYRIVSSSDSESSLEVLNNTIFSYLFIFVLLSFSLFTLAVYYGFIINPLHVFLAIVLAFFIYINNWLTNFLIGKKRYQNLNKNNSLAALAGLIVLPMAYFYGVTGAILTIIIQPFIFSVVVLSQNSETRPTYFKLELSMLKKIWSFGFIPFLSGIFYLVYLQVERWSIVAYIDTEALGQAYLFFMIVTMWVLIPSSIMNLFFPRAVMHYQKKRYKEMNRMIVIHFFVVVAYCLVASIAITLLLSPLVNIVFPKHLPFVELVIFALPGLICRSMTDPIAVFLNSVARFRPIFWSDVFSFLVYLIFLSCVILYDNFSLKNIVYAFVVYNFSKMLYLIVSYYHIQTEFKRME